MSGFFWKKANTKVAEILKEADVSAGSFQNIFPHQGRRADRADRHDVQQAVRRGKAAGGKRPLAGVPLRGGNGFAAGDDRAERESAGYLCGSVHLPATAEIIHRSTTAELQAAFSAYLPGCAECDFYEMELGTAGMMRGYMARRCDPYFTLERKIRRYLSMSLSALQVPRRSASRSSLLWRRSICLPRRGRW